MPKALPIVARWSLGAGLLWLTVAAVTYGCDRRAERRFPPAPEGPWTVARRTVGDCHWRWFEAGSGPPLVLLHGAYGGAEDFLATLWPTVAQRYRVFAVDRPGHGFTAPVGGRSAAQFDRPSAQARALRVWLEELGLDRPLVVGFSYGGAVAAALAAEHPQSLGGALLLAAPLYPWHGRPDLLDLCLAAPGLGALASHGGLSLAARLLAPSLAAQSFAPAPVDPRFRRGSPVPLAVRAASLRQNARELSRLDRALELQSRHYPSIAVPIEVLHGSADRTAWSSRHAVPFAAAQPTAVYTELPGAGHNLLYSHTDQVLAALDRLAARVAQQR
jgi:pimeloyl-ACP methyl ester carboxylesterase